METLIFTSCTLLTDIDVRRRSEIREFPKKSVGPLNSDLVGELMMGGLSIIQLF